MTERDPRKRPPDPAGTRPKHDPQDLLPRTREPLLWGGAAPPAPPPAEREGVVEIPHDDEILYPGRAAAATRADAPPVAAGGPEQAAYAPRLQFITGALVAVALAAIAALAIVVWAPGDAGEGARGPTWSSWIPREGAGDGATQIANHVGRQYRLPTGEQLVAVTGGPLEVAGLPMTIAMRNQRGDIDVVDGGGVLYRLCGLGPSCAIDKGKASTQRHLLLRREALELALYSFRYLEDVDHVVVFMPPRKGQEPTQALFFRRGDLAGALARPLTATLTPRTPSVTTVARSPDASLVNSITTRGLFQFRLTQANQDARAFLVLEPPPVR